MTNKRVIQEVTHDEAPLYNENEDKVEYKKKKDGIWVLQNEEYKKIPSRY
mgnify:CR=1 FL=1|tara:strand:- start:3896 stop:4045 length:150 start_codon:yes stop_codon:yes gene_type:complete